MSKIDNKAEYYFGAKPVLEKGADEDEFDGSFTDPVDLEKLELIQRLNLPPFWEQIWIELATLRCGIEVNEGSGTIILTDISELAREKSFPQQQIWSESINSARKKGWDWSGDTDIYVKTLDGPKNLADAVISLMISEHCGEFWMDLSTMAHAPSEQSTYQSWSSFWNDGCNSYENDLPAWKGRPERDVVLKSDGNTRIHLAQKSGGSFVTVYFYTS